MLIDRYFWNYFCGDENAKSKNTAAIRFQELRYKREMGSFNLIFFFNQIDNNWKTERRKRENLWELVGKRDEYIVDLRVMGICNERLVYRQNGSDGDRILFLHEPTGVLLSNL